MKPIFEKVYCAFCRLERGVCRKKHISWTNVLLSALCAALLMFVVWSRLEPKAIIIFAVAMMLAEVFVHLRWRLTLPCPHCHFDPILYKRNSSLAAERVKRRLNALQLSGEHLLRTNNPFQNLPKREISKNDSKLMSPQTKPEPLLSRHV